MKTCGDAAPSIIRRVSSGLDALKKSNTNVDDEELSGTLLLKANLISNDQLATDLDIRIFIVISHRRRLLSPFLLFVKFSH